MKENNHFFPFFYRDFVHGTQLLSTEEIGAYILLLCYQWDEGKIPNDDKILKKIIKKSPKKFQKLIQDKFTNIDNFLVNSRLEEVRVYLKFRSESAKRSINARWKKDTNSIRNEYESDTNCHTNSILPNTNTNTNNAVVVVNKPTSTTTFDGFMNECICDIAWCGLAMKNLSINSTDELTQKLLEFKESCGLLNKYPPDINEFKRHFSAWMRRINDINAKSKLINPPKFADPNYGKIVNE